MKPVITLPQAAAALRKSYNQTLRLVLVGKLRGQQRNGRWLVDAQDVARLACESKQHDQALENATDQGC